MRLAEAGQINIHQPRNATVNSQINYLLLAGPAVK